MFSSSSAPEEEDYDPHKHRRLKKGTNAWESFVHLIKCALGTGILAMPQGFAKVGMVIGVLSNIIGGILITHCLHLVVRSSYIQCKRLKVPLLPYSDAMTTAIEYGPPRFRRFAKCLGLSIEVFLIIYQLGVCCVYILFIASSIKKLVDPQVELSIHVHMLIVIGPLILINLIPNLKYLAPFSAVANGLILLGLGAIVYFAFTEPKPDQPLKLFGAFTEIPLFFGTVLFALTAVGVVIAVELNMKNPMQFRGTFGVFNCAMAFIVVVYVAIGIIGYNFCRDNCKDSITLNTPQNVWLADLVVAVYALAILLSYSLHCYVPVEIIMDIWKKSQTTAVPPRKIMTYNYALRIALCIITFSLAMAIPRLGLFISLFGALCIPALAMFFPVLMEAVDTKNIYILIKDAIIFVCGVVAMVSGCFSAITEIMDSLLGE